MVSEFIFVFFYLSSFQNTRRYFGKTSLCILKKVYFFPWLINNVYLFDRKISFKNYEERKAAAEKICKEAEKLENLFSKLTTTKSKVDANFLSQSLAISISLVIRQYIRTIRKLA